MNYKQPEKKIREILQRYINGECTEQEKTQLEEWFERVEGAQGMNHPLGVEDEERLIVALRQAMAVKKEGGNETERTGEKEGEEGEPGRLSGNSPGKLLKIRRVLRHAAIWIGVIVLGGGMGAMLYKRWQRLPAPKEIVFNEIITGYGEVRKVLLPDHSVVWLNSATRLLYHPDFLQHRELRLTGEAFFEVAPDVHHPFIVQSGNASTRVFGTAFNISAYAATGQLRISLQSGKVGVIYDSKAGKMDRMLTSGQLFIYDKESGAGQIEQQSPGEMDVWTGGRLLFYKTPLKEALAQIEARYGVPIVCDRALKNQTITARFENTALEKVLEHLSFGWDLHFTRNKDTLHVQ